MFILPEIEEGTLYQTIANNSTKFTGGVLHRALSMVLPGGGASRFHRPVKSLFVPKFFGRSDRRSVGSGDRHRDFARKRSTGYDLHQFVDRPRRNNGTGIGLTNYMAMLGTHIDPTATGPSGGTKSASSSASNNGAMTFRGISFDQGRKLAGLSDGASKTPLAGETKEKRLSSWYDGTANWLCGARHGNLTGVLVNPPASSHHHGERERFERQRQMGGGQQRHHEQRRRPRH